MSDKEQGTGKGEEDSAESRFAEAVRRRLNTKAIRKLRPTLGPDSTAEDVRAYIQWGIETARQDPAFMAAVRRRQITKQVRREHPDK